MPSRSPWRTSRSANGAPASSSLRAVRAASAARPSASRSPSPPTSPESPRRDSPSPRRSPSLPAGRSTLRLPERSCAAPGRAGGPRGRRRRRERPRLRRRIGSRWGGAPAGSRPHPPPRARAPPSPRAAEPPPSADRPESVSRPAHYLGERVASSPDRRISYPGNRCKPSPIPSSDRLPCAPRRRYSALQTVHCRPGIPFRPSPPFRQPRLPDGLNYDESAV